MKKDSLRYANWAVTMGRRIGSFIFLADKQEVNIIFVLFHLGVSKVKKRHCHHLTPLAAAATGWNLEGTARLKLRGS